MTEQGGVMWTGLMAADGPQGELNPLPFCSLITRSIGTTQLLGVRGVFFLEAVRGEHLFLCHDWPTTACLQCACASRPSHLEATCKNNHIYKIDQMLQLLQKV